MSRPPGIAAGRSDDFINTTDLHATIASLAGAAVSTPDSIDFSPVLTGGTGTREFVYIEHFTERETRGGGIYGWALRQGDFKLVVANGQDEELYNVVDDPFELDNLLAADGNDEHRAIAAALASRRDGLVSGAE
ncbi:MAG: hypothetical protein JJ920_20610 [Roseitalea sp.]|nr:hypothetical protein [Roseitalea sp.]MBO6723520.1 hypothetical protein [Roseitalea sp.]MBO6745316.1 hypothetical protein [Roseitalea sp.]